MGECESARAAQAEQGSPFRLQFFGSYVLALSHSHAGYLYRSQVEGGGSVVLVVVVVVGWLSMLYQCVSIGYVLDGLSHLDDPLQWQQSNQLNATCKCRLPPMGGGKERELRERGE